jgi:small subunit ribosomal protein S8e
VRGGNTKFRAMRLDTGNFSWGSEAITRKTRIVAVVYNASNNELVRTNTLVKSAVVQIDANPFKQWYEAHYGLALGKKKKKNEDGTEEAAVIEKKCSKHAAKKVELRKKDAAIDPALEDQFSAGRLYALITSRPGQSGRCDGLVLEGKELEFYLRKMKTRK